MSHFLDRLTYLSRRRVPFADGHGELRDEDRMWEEGYRRRWQHDKIVRSTHGVNCTGSCSWRIFVKSGVVAWEMQQTDYPRTRPGMPNHEPRGCSRGASYSWYLYSANRIKYPLVRSRLVKVWREARQTLAPVEAWGAIVGNAQTASSYKSVRGRGGFVRSSWDEVSEIIAAANVFTIKTWGPDRIVGFSPIPAMSMVSYAAGTRYLSLIGGTLLSFYDWYCDLPPASPQTWGEQTDVPESADWYNSAYIIAWGSNVPQTRTPDAHFFVEARYSGTRVVAITPDYAEVAKFSDLWLHPKQGTDAALAMAIGHVILHEFFLDRQVRISRIIAATTPTCRCWCGCGRTARTGCRTAICARETCPERHPPIAPRGRPWQPLRKPASWWCRRDRSAIAGPPTEKRRGAGTSKPRMARAAPRSASPSA
jgi:nitrate reductase alpha subunit